MNKTPRKPDNELIKIAVSPREARSWKGRAVVVDVLRCSTTLCALLARGKKTVRVFGRKKDALAFFKEHKGWEFYSELDCGKNFRKFDNSPWQALRLSSPKKPAVIVTGAGTKAMASLGGAKQILAGCFANLPQIAGHLKAHPEKTKIFPACLFFSPWHIEDKIGAQAIKDAAEGRRAAAAAIKKIKSSARLREFLDSRPENGQRDQKIALTAGGLKILPEIKLNGHYAAVKNLCKKKR